jgi:hypothetical protein
VTPILLDSSFLIDLERETAAGTIGPARTFLPALKGRTLAVSVVSVEASVLPSFRPSDTDYSGFPPSTHAGLNLEFASHSIESSNDRIARVMCA